MLYGICPDCKEFKPLTKHSKIGNHKPPFKLICRACHDKIHNIIVHPHINKKYQPGTPKSKRK